MKWDKGDVEEVQDSRMKREGSRREERVILHLSSKNEILDVVNQ